MWRNKIEPGKVETDNFNQWKVPPQLGFFFMASVYTHMDYIYIERETAHTYTSPQSNMAMQNSPSTWLHGTISPYISQLKSKSSISSVLGLPKQITAGSRFPALQCCAVASLWTPTASRGSRRPTAWRPWLFRPKRLRFLRHLRCSVPSFSPWSHDVSRIGLEIGSSTWWVGGWAANLVDIM